VASKLKLGGLRVAVGLCCLSATPALDMRAGNTAGHCRLVPLPAQNVEAALQPEEADLTTVHVAVSKQLRRLEVGVILSSSVVNEQCGCERQEHPSFPPC